MKSVENTSPLPIEGFIEEIRKQLDKGYGFTPFVGSGISAASGLMMGRDFDSYLIYAVYRCVAPGALQSLGKRWDLHRDGWLRKPTGRQYEEAETWLRERYKELIAHHGANSTIPFPPPFKFEEPVDGDSKKTPIIKETLERFGAENAAWHSQVEAACRRWENLDGNDSNDPSRKELAKCWRDVGVAKTEFSTIEKAIRSLYDWKAILAFLSHAKLAGHVLDFLPAGNPLIIDRFNLHITWGQKPNLAHTQLVHLSRPLRIRQIFTTNFDTLIEQAFHEVRIPLRVIETTTSASLPDEALVLGANCLVKFHGGSQQTRADFSLNEPASKEDKQRFVSYLRQRRKIGDNDSCCHIPNHLLLIGLSGSDWRVIDMIQSALWALPDLKVFCIANSATSEKTFNDRLAGWSKDRVKIFVLGRADLALLRLYQDLTLSLPPGGFLSQFNQFVPAGETSDKLHKLAAKETLAFLEKACVQKGDIGFRPIDLVPQIPDEENKAQIEVWQRVARPAFTCSEKRGWIATATGHSGIMRYFQTLFDCETARRKQSVWVELEDYGSSIELPAEILRILSLNRGRYQTTHVDLDRHPMISNSEDFRDWIGRVMEFLDLDPNDCAIFLYGRNGPGGCSGLHAPYWDKSEYDTLEALLAALQESGFRVYYMPFSEDRWHRNLEKEGSHPGEKGIMHRVSLMSAGQVNAEHQEYRTNLWPHETPEIASGFCQRLPKSIVHHYGLPAPQADVAVVNAEDLSRMHSFDGLIDRVCSEFLGDDQNVGGTDCWKLLQEKVGTSWFGGNGRLPQSPWKRVQFLYACTLFRQSRHPSALISEGSFSCPLSFNVDSDDNDLIRAKSVKKWIKDLRKLGLFRDKPGGYLWQYRDTRLGIQALLESLTNLEIRPGSKIEFLGQRRARLHFWIGEWHRDAFMATRHLIPMIESIYHRCSAIFFSKWAKPSHMALEKDMSAILQYRLHLIVGSLREITDLLELGAPMAAFWQPGQTGGKLFSRISILKAIRCEDWTSDWNEDASRQWLSEVLGEEGSAHPESAKFSKTIVRLLANLVMAADTISASMESEGASGFAAMLRTGGGFAGAASPQEVQCTVLRANFCYQNEIDQAVDKLKEVASSCFVEFKADWIFDMSNSKIPNDRVEREALVAQARETLSPCILNRPETAYLALQSLAEIAYVRIKTNKLQSRPRMVIQDVGRREGAEMMRWVAVTMVCSIGLSLLRVCHSVGIGERVLLRQKFLAFYALALGFLGRFHEAHRRLNQANALSLYLPELQSEMATVILRIRRAELHLAEAETLARTGGISIDPQDLSHARRVCAKVDDAVVSLDAAEHLLQGRSHSSLWWGRYYSLRLRSVGFSVRLARLSSANREKVVSLALRRRYDYFGAIREIFGRAELLCQDDTYRFLRTLDYTIGAVRGVIEVVSTSNTDNTYSVLELLKVQNERLFNDLLAAWLRLLREKDKSGDKWNTSIKDYFGKLEPFFAGYVTDPEHQ